MWQTHKQGTLKWHDEWQDQNRWGGGVILSRAWNNFYYPGFSAESLGLLQLYFGVGLLLFHIVQFESLIRLNPTGPSFYFLEPMWQFTFLGIDYHLPALSFVMFIALMGATVSMALAKWTRTSIVVVIICIF